MRKNEIISRIAKMTQKTNKEIKDILDSFGAIINETMENKKTFSFLPFFKIYIKRYPKRKSLNPATGEKFILPQRDVVKIATMAGLKKFKEFIR